MISPLDEPAIVSRIRNKKKKNTKKLKRFFNSLAHFKWKQMRWHSLKTIFISILLSISCIFSCAYYLSRSVLKWQERENKRQFLCEVISSSLCPQVFFGERFYISLAHNEWKGACLVTHALSLIPPNWSH